MSKHRITKDERRHQDYLRRKGLKVGAVYEARLLRVRAHEVKRVLEICQDYYNPEQWPLVIQDQLDETGYLPKWWNGLFADAGLPMCQSTARDLNKAKAAGDRNLWLSMLLEYATRRAGESIVGVSGTLRESLIDILRGELLDDPLVSIEKLTKRIFRRYQELAKWQVRRIAQTETMIAMADAANAAAGTLDISFTKQWCISGLGNTRDSHLAMDGVEVDQNEPFTLEGGLMMYPHDTSMGALASEIINCACSCIRRPKAASRSGSAERSTLQEPQGSFPKPASQQQIQNTPSTTTRNAQTEEGYSPKLKKAILSKESEIRTKKNEQACIFDPEKEKLSYTIKGKGAQINIAAEGGFSKDSIVTHNHPRAIGKKGLAAIGNSFSFEDLESAISYDIREIRAVTPTYTFSMRRPESGWGVSSDTLERIYKAEDWKLHHENEAYIRAALNEQDRVKRIERCNATHYHDLSSRLALRFGWIYSKKNS